MAGEYSTVGGVRNMYKMLGGNPEGKRPLRRTGHR